MSNPVAVVTGVGPGTGAAVVRRFSRGGYDVAMLARSRVRLAVTDEAELDGAPGAIRADLGTAPTS